MKPSEEYKQMEKDFNRRTKSLTVAMLVALPGSIFIMGTFSEWGGFIHLLGAVGLLLGITHFDSDFNYYRALAKFLKVFHERAKGSKKLRAVNRTVLGLLTFLTAFVFLNNYWLSFYTFQYIFFMLLVACMGLMLLEDREYEKIKKRTLEELDKNFKEES